MADPAEIVVEITIRVSAFGFGCISYYICVSRAGRYSARRAPPDIFIIGAGVGRVDIFDLSAFQLRTQELAETGAPCLILQLVVGIMAGLAVEIPVAVAIIRGAAGVGLYLWRRPTAKMTALAQIF